MTSMRGPKITEVSVNNIDASIGAKWYMIVEKLKWSRCHAHCVLQLWSSNHLLQTKWSFQWEISARGEFSNGISTSDIKLAKHCFEKLSQEMKHIFPGPLLQQSTKKWLLRSRRDRVTVQVDQVTTNSTVIARVLKVFCCLLSGRWKLHSVRLSGEMLWETWSKVQQKKSVWNITQDFFLFIALTKNDQFRREIIRHLLTVIIWLLLTYFHLPITNSFFFLQ